jgi:hypothetical protein
MGEPTAADGRRPAGQAVATGSDRGYGKRTRRPAWTLTAPFEEMRLAYCPINHRDSMKTAISEMQPNITVALSEDF